MTSSNRYKRGFADGSWGHPPAELTEEYLSGYVEGLKNQQHEEDPYGFIRIFPRTK